jgi:predicted N-acyltransferase
MAVGQGRHALLARSPSGGYVRGMPVATSAADGLEVSVLSAIGQVEAAAWDALFAHEPDEATPFLRHAFLAAMEESGSAAPGTGWSPRHLLLRRNGRLVAAAPAYLKEDSDGDFSRDWEWAAAAARAGARFYPKLVLGVPATPVTGRRLLVARGEERAEAVELLLEQARRIVREGRAGGLHVLFPTAAEALELEAAGLARRVDFQYHWRNQGDADLEGFLARFPSKRRNTIRRELRAPAEQGITIRTVRGGELARDPGGWADECYALHQASTDQMAWGMRWVNQAFYQLVLARMPDAVEVVEARRDGRLIGMAFNLASPSVLYGRYWGNLEEHPFLHFNVALYHSIAECLSRGVKRFEGGAGGEHKLSRGFEPAETWSCHAFTDPRLDAAVRRHLGEEVPARLAAVARWREEHPRLGG